jgi:hypothetical protein
MISTLRRSEAWLIAGLSAGAAAIHLAAAPGHVEELGDLGLTFYWAALIQFGIAVVALSRPVSPSFARYAIAANFAFIGAWAVTRTVGWPMLGEGPEPIGVADGICVLLQASLIGLLVARLGGLDRRLLRAWGATTVPSVATTGLVATLSLVLLSTVIGVRAAGDEHHDEGPAAAHTGMPMDLGGDPAP